MTWADIIRLLNSAGCAVSIWFLAASAFHQWRSWNNKTQAHWWALFGWVFLGLEGSLESFLLGVTPGPRVIIQTLVVAWTLRALSIQEDLQAKPTPRSWKENR